MVFLLNRPEWDAGGVRVQLMVLVIVLTNKISLCFYPVLNRHVARKPVGYHFSNSSIASPTFSIEGIISCSKVELSGTAGIFTAPMVRTGASSH